MRLVFFIFVVFLSTYLHAEEACPLRQKIGQMLLVGISDKIYSDLLAKETAATLKRLHIGGVVLMGYNVVGTSASKLQCADKAQVKNFVNALQSDRQPKMFIAIDQEGGSIQRLKECSGFKEIPSHAEIGQLKNPKMAYNIAYRAALELREVGINWNFAPVLDVNGQTKNSVIGGLDRSLSANPKAVASLGQSLFQGTQAAGLIASAKHFPGHGAAANDSHISAAHIDKSWDEIAKKDLIPFANAFKNGVDSVMVGHISLNSKCGFGTELSSLNEQLLQKIVRDKMKYNGLMVTDDLSMGAITEKYTLNEAAKKAILAGNDILIIRIGDYANAIDSLCKETSLKTEDAERLRLRIEQANERIATLKKNKGL